MSGSFVEGSFEDVVLSDLTASDDALLRTFRCARDRHFEIETEQAIRRRLISAERSTSLHPFKFLGGRTVVGVGAHQPGRLVLASDEGDVVAAEIYLLALATPHHGSTLRDGSRLSDRCLELLLIDALQTHDTEYAYGLVDVENARSLALCERVGLTSQSTVNDDLVRVSGRFVFS